jgi:stearoyl-CoA desaturase (delta-9 desaturase)
MGYHRLHTHRSYETPKVIEYFFAVCATMTLQGGPIFWTACHRIHHQYSDCDGDPHTPRDGRWWSHMLWVMFGNPMNADTAVMGKYAPDLMKDRFYRVLSKWHWVPLVLLGLVLLAIGGLPWLLWGVFLRVVFGLHCTWLVNSATHLWGTRRFETPDDSKNSWWVALLTFGEGWHNNHHAHPTSARHGLGRFELDLTWIQIRLLEKLGLAWDVRVPTRTQIARKTLSDLAA